MSSMLSMPAGSDSCDRTLQVARAAQETMLTRRLKGPVSTGLLQHAAAGAGGSLRGLTFRSGSCLVGFSGLRFHCAWDMIAGCCCCALPGQWLEGWQAVSTLVK